MGAGLTQDKRKNPKPQHKMSFPVMTLSRTRQMNSAGAPHPDTTEVTQSADQDQEVDNETEYDEEVNGSEEESEQGDYETLHPVYKRIKVKHIKELHSAVKNYGIHAPFTFSILEGLAGYRFLLLLEWSKVVQSVLTRGQYLTWKSEFQDRAETMARQNRKKPTESDCLLDCR